jgi:hypothetical protein
MDAFSAFASATARELESGVYQTPEAADAVMATRVKALPAEGQVVIKVTDRR